MKRKSIFILILLFFLPGMLFSLSETEKQNILNKLESLNSYQEIINQGEPYLKDLENNNKYLSLMAQAYINENLLNKALTLVNKIDNTYPTKFFWGFLANFLLGKKQKALSFLENLKKRIDFGSISPQFLQLYYGGKAELYLTDGKLEKAKEELDKIKKEIKKPDSYFYYLMARYSFLKGNYSAVDKYLNIFQQEEGETGLIYSLKAEIALKNGETEKAKKLLEKSASLFGKKGALWCDGIMAILYYHKVKKQLDSSLRLFKKLPLKFSLEKLLAFAVTNKQYWDKNSWEELLNSSKEIIWTLAQLQQGNLEFPTDRNITQILILTAGMTKIALSIFNREIFPDKLETYYSKLVDKYLISDKNFDFLANILSKFSLTINLTQNNNLEEAEKVLNELEEINRSDFLKALTKIQEFYPIIPQDLKDDIPLLSKRLWDFFQIALFTLKGDLALKREDFEDANYNYKKAYQLNPDFFQAIEKIVDKRVQTMNPENIFFATGRGLEDLYYELSLYYFKCQNRKKAIQLLEKARTLFPQNRKIYFLNKKLSK